MSGAGRKLNSQVERHLVSVNETKAMMVLSKEFKTEIEDKNMPAADAQHMSGEETALSLINRDLQCSLTQQSMKDA